MKYTVEINCTAFVFNDGHTAISFAEIAKESAREDVYVRITVEKEVEKDDEKGENHERNKMVRVMGAR